MQDSDSEEVLYELPSPPAFLPKKQPDWGPMTTASTRFAVSTLRKSSKVSILRCSRLFGTTKEADRLAVALDRVSRQVKSDMLMEQVPKTLQKDRRHRSQLVDDIDRSVEQMSKKRKISVFMETYLLDVLDEKQEAAAALEQELLEEGGGGGEAAAFQGTIFPSPFEMATRANRALPASFARPVRYQGDLMTVLPPGGEANGNRGATDATKLFLALAARVSD